MAAKRPSSRPKSKRSRSSRQASAEALNEFLGTGHPNILVVEDFAPEGRMFGVIIRVETDLRTTDVGGARTALADLTSKRGRARAKAFLLQLASKQPGARPNAVRRLITGALSNEDDPN